MMNSVRVFLECEPHFLLKIINKINLIMRIFSLEYYGVT